MQSQIPPNLASQHYATQLGSFDEMLSNQNKVQPHWQDFMQSLEAMEGAELENRRKEVERLLRENGVTYTVYNDDSQLSRPWKLDPVPLLIGSDEWQHIDYGLQQRAELFNLILKDLYGEQTLLTKGLLPPELIYAHAGFWLPCMGSLSDAARLTIYAANLARGPNGAMWVLNDHTQAPSGIGYSLENRHVLGRVMGDLFQESQVQRLAGFFNKLQNSLAEMAHQHKDEPHIVVLTPGPLNETYFEHAYLASQLGFTLAQGEDLTMRDGKVWLRTLEGLQPVDVLLRRVDDGYCDPLELHGHSQLGVAGLLQAVRLGNVSIANPLGSGILENPGLLGFLPSLSRHFLNEELKLPSAATWWCGQKKERDFVLNNLAKLTIKSIYRGNQQAIVGAQLDKAQQDELIAKIKANPHLFVGQEQIDFSTAPTLVGGAMEPRNCILRSFAVASDASYHVMPGGLTRVAANKDQFTVSNQVGAISKDTWVLSSKDKVVQSQSQGQNLPAFVSTRRIVSAIAEPLASRAADNLFWVGRHFERIFFSARLLQTIQSKQLSWNGTAEPKSQDYIAVLLHAVTHLTGTYPGFIVADKPLSKLERCQELYSLYSDQQRAGTMANNIEEFYVSAFNIRDLWSQETWRCIDAMRNDWQSEVKQLDVLQVQKSTLLHAIGQRLVAFSGLTSESMTRESGWLFLQLGRRLERALALISMLRATVVVKHDEVYLSAVLEAILLVTDSFSVYQRRYRSAVSLPMLLKLLISDASHPYSLLFQVKNLHDSLAKLPGQSENKLSAEQGLILRIYTDVRLCDFALLLDTEGQNGINHQLDKVLEQTSKSLWDFSDLLAQHYFRHIETQHQMAPLQKEGVL